MKNIGLSETKPLSLHEIKFCQGFKFYMKKIRKRLFCPLLGCCTALAMLLFNSACSGDNKDQLESTVDSFSVAYFNWRFPAALKYCTPQSRQWLVYAASQVNESDVEALRNKQEGASCQIDDIDFTDDSTAVVNVVVHNFLAMDAIGLTPQVVPAKAFRLRAIERQGVWKIHLDGLPD